MITVLFLVLLAELNASLHPSLVYGKPCASGLFMQLIGGNMFSMFTEGNFLVAKVRNEINGVLFWSRKSNSQTWNHLDDDKDIDNALKTMFKRLKLKEGGLVWVTHKK